MMGETEGSIDADATTNRVDDERKIAVAGDFLDRVTVLSSVNVSLVLIPGKRQDNGSHLLVPFTSIDMAGSSVLTEEPKSYLSQIISLDNLAFLTAALASELERVTTEYVEIAQGGARLDTDEQSRLALQMKRLLGHAHACVEKISSVDEPVE